MRIAIACDHIGFPLKASIVEALEGEDHAVLDLGTHSADPVDYPPMAKAVATAIGKGFVDAGILLCESSIGGAMAGNRLTSIRAAACQDADGAREAREKLNVNLLCIGGGADDPARIVREWVKAQFSNSERDVRTIARINELDSGALRGPSAAAAAAPITMSSPAAATASAAPAPSAPAAEAAPKTADITPVMKLVAGVK